MTVVVIASASRRPSYEKMPRTSVVRTGSMPRLCMTLSTWSFSFFDFSVCFLAVEISEMSSGCFFDKIAAKDDGCGTSVCIQWCFWTMSNVYLLAGSRTSIFRTSDSQSGMEMNVVILVGSVVTLHTVMLKIRVRI